MFQSFLKQFSYSLSTWILIKEISSIFLYMPFLILVAFLTVVKVAVRVQQMEAMRIINKYVRNDHYLVVIKSTNDLLASILK